MSPGHSLLAGTSGLKAKPPLLQRHELDEMGRLARKLRKMAQLLSFLNAIFGRFCHVPPKNGACRKSPTGSGYLKAGKRRLGGCRHASPTGSSTNSRSEFLRAALFLRLPSRFYAGNGSNRSGRRSRRGRRSCTTGRDRGRSGSRFGRRSDGSRNWSGRSKIRGVHRILFERFICRSRVGAGANVPPLHRLCRQAKTILKYLL